MASDASDTTIRKLRRTLYADRVIQETTYNNGLKNYVVSEGDCPEGAIHYTTYHNIRNGALVTTPEERQAYINSVPTLAPPITVPDAPTSVIVTRGISQVTVTFTMPIHDGGATITSYTVTSNPGGFTATGPSSPLTVTGLTNGTSYTFTVIATNDVGNSAPSVASSPVIPASVPDVPTSVSATSGNSQAIVSFTPPINNGGIAITSYTVTSDPGGFTATGPSSPLTVTGLTNGTSYTFTVVATNDVGNSQSSSASGAVIPATVPDAPTSVSASATNSQATVSFTPPINNGGTAITSYTVTSNPGGFTATGPSSPLTVTGLTNDTPYTFTVVATNSVGNSVNSAASNVVTPTAPANTPLAPVLTSVTFKTTDSMTIAFTQASNGTSAITNYKYSLNGGAYTALSPADAATPVTISGLSSNTLYTITLKAVNSNGDSAASNALTETTYANVNYATFTDVGESSWTAPQGVTFVQYLIVGGGGGGGAAYSKITVLGNVLVTDTPQPGAYWINSANLTNGRYSGRMYYGNNSGQNSSSFPDPIRLTASQDFTPSGVVYSYNKWYGTELVYMLSGALVMTTNYFTPYTINSTQCNNISGGGGGGAGGQVKSLSGTAKYTVVPGQTYTVIVGAGGAGGIGGVNTEAVGSPGESSSFDTITSSGGSGGGHSRSTGFIVNGFGNGGVGGQSSGNLVGGCGGGQTSANNYARYNSGGPGANGTLANFGTGNTFYGGGGTGGVPNTAATGTTVANLGKGGMGTGATLNSYANGIDGGSGIVIIRYYT